MSVRVLPVSGRAGRNRFISVQWDFYRDDPHWVPPLRMERRKLLDPQKNPFFQHAEMQLFIAEKDGAPAGRIAAIVNRNHNQVHGDRVGFFGFFECRNDQAVASALFDAAAAWLREQDMDTMRGPINPSINDEIGLLVKGFDRPPVILMTYNPQYYEALILDAGFRKEKDMYAWLLHNKDVTTPKLERGQELVRRRFNVTVRDVDFKRLDSEMLLLEDLYNRSWEKNWGAVAMTDPEFRAMAKDLAQVIGKFKNLAVVAEKDGVPVGFALCLPDLNQVLIRNRGGGLLGAAWHMMTGMKRVDLVRIMVLGVLPEYRGKGIDAVMYWETLQRAARHGVFLGEASWVLEDNTMMNHGLKLMQADPYKTYRVFDRAL
jgi:GNAT superfamily N-acetyltransferase